MTAYRDKLEFNDLQPKVADKTGVVVQSIIYLFTFAAAEYVTYYLNSTGGIIFHFIILLSLFISSAISKNTTQRRFWLALGLVPFIRITTLVIPADETSEIFWYILIAIPVIAATVAMMRNLKINAEDIGLNNRNPLIQTLVAIGGIGLGFIDYLFLKPEALNSQLTIETTLFPALVLLVFTGFVEEIAFRGVLQREASALGPWGWILVASVYAVLQIGHGSPWHLMFALGMALYFGWIVKKTGSILGVSIGHGLLNIGLFLIFPNIF